MSNISNYLIHLFPRFVSLNQDLNNFHILNFFGFLKSLLNYSFSSLFHFPYNLFVEEIKSLVMSCTVSHSLDFAEGQLYGNI